MDTTQRKLAVITSLGKRYSGLVDIPNPNFRTTDLFNSVYTYWKNPDEKCFDNSIMMHDARLLLDDTSVYRQFDKIQIRISEVFYFYDDVSTVGDQAEKKRATSLSKKTNEGAQEIDIITRQVASSFYEITGTFFGIFRQRAKDKFVPLTQANIVEIYKRQDKWMKKTIVLPHQFICLSNDHIEAVTVK
jgi:hypothetical protein